MSNQTARPTLTNEALEAQINLVATRIKENQHPLSIAAESMLKCDIENYKALILEHSIRYVESI